MGRDICAHMGPTHTPSPSLSTKKPGKQLNPGGLPFQIHVSWGILLHGVGTPAIHVSPAGFALQFKPIFISQGPVVWKVRGMSVTHGNLCLIALVGSRI
jgi:hypothetical protein